MYDLNNLTFEKMQELQTLPSRKGKKEQLWREHKKRQVIHIFVDAFGIIDLNNQHKFFDQLVYIVDNVQ